MTAEDNKKKILAGTVAVNNRDIEGRIKIEIDDFLFELNVKHNITLPLEQVDQLIEECLKVAKLKYN